MNNLRAFIADKPVILDGGFSTELETAGHHIQGDVLWSARILHTNPNAVKDVHHRFIRGGADVITTATYQASIEGFVRHLDVTPDHAQQLLMSGVHLAKEAVGAFMSELTSSGRRVPLVAGSMGPYGAFLHDCSEYTGAYADQMSVEELKDWHRPQMRCLTMAGADLVAMETIPSLKEAEALIGLLREFPECKAWLSFSCKDALSISDGKRFSEAVQVVGRCPQLVAVGVNCCSPNYVKPLLESARAQRGGDLSWVVYPNGEGVWEYDTRWKGSGNKLSFGELSCDWAREGAMWIGGCCGVGPADIAELKQLLHGQQQE